MKKFLLRISIFLFFLILGTLFSVAFDPYGVFHPGTAPDYKGLAINLRFAKSVHYLNNSAQYQTLLFGSSRVGAINVEKLDPTIYGRTYNMTYSIGTPQDHLEDISYFVEKGAVPKTIIIGIDEGSASNIFLNPSASLLRKPYPYDTNIFEFYLPYLNPSLGIKALLDSGSLENLKLMFNGTPDETIYTHGCSSNMQREPLERYNISAERHAAKKGFQVIPLKIIPKDNFDKTLSCLLDIKKICDDNDIELIIFTNPTYYARFIQGGTSGYLEFLGELQKDMNFYNFSGINTITTDTAYYFETVHYSRKAGDFIVNVLNGENLNQELEDQFFGVKTNGSNITLMLDAMQTSINNFIKDNPSKVNKFT